MAKRKRLNVRNEGKNVFVDDIDALNEGEAVEEDVWILSDLNARLGIFLDVGFGTDALSCRGGLCCRV